jgi:hypothetical protein
MQLLGASSTMRSIIEDPDTAITLLARKFGGSSVSCTTKQSRSVQLLAAHVTGSLWLTWHSIQRLPLPMPRNPTHPPTK